MFSTMKHLWVVCGFLALAGALVAQPDEPRGEDVFPEFEDRLHINRSRERPGAKSFHGSGYPGYVEYLAAWGLEPKEKLGLFRVLGRDEDGTIWANYRVNWEFMSDIKDGEHMSLAGQIYQWDGRRSNLNRVPDHKLAVELKDPVRRFSFNRWFAVQKWNPTQKREDKLSFGFDFAKQKPGDRAAGRLNIRIGTEGDKLLRPEVSARLDPGQNDYLVKEGDVIQTELWKATIMRIVYPDDEQHLAG